MIVMSALFIFELSNEILAALIDIIALVESPSIDFIACKVAAVATCPNLMLAESVHIDFKNLLLIEEYTIEISNLFSLYMELAYIPRIGMKDLFSTCFRYFYSGRVVIPQPKIEYFALIELSRATSDVTFLCDIFSEISSEFTTLTDSVIADFVVSSSEKSDLEKCVELVGVLKYFAKRSSCVVDVVKKLFTSDLSILRLSHDLFPAVLVAQFHFSLLTSTQISGFLISSAFTSYLELCGN